MSHENVEVVRLILEGFNSREWAAWESHHHPDFETSDPPETPAAELIVAWAASAASWTGSKLGMSGT